ncbi:MAG: hypothetical protein JJE50_04115 [Actinomycetales bacterium]|nr:hypothetical protein [Actinomycetales bacterium]
MALAPGPAAVRRRLAVLADDLTGAADAAAPFASRGLDVSVALSDTTPQDVEVLALVTDNRWRPAPEAAERMRAAVSRVRAWGPEMLFLKIDSTLRGRVRADVSVALDAWGSADAVATPAFPAQGRIVREGALVVHGETTVARIDDHFPDGVRVVDAESHDGLVETARRILDDGAVAVGSGGLASALADVLVHTPPPRRGPRARVTGVLLVVGTAHAATRGQVSTLLAAGAQLVVVGSSTPSPVDAATTALHGGRRVVLTCDVVGEVEPDSRQAAALAEDLARVVRAVVDAAPSVGLVLTGGATALAVATALGARELRLLSEVAEGLPLGEMVVGDRRIPVVTKSGGFGSQDSLCRAAEALEDCA